MASHRTYPTRGSGKHARTEKDNGRLERCVIALPGGCGTLEELLEIITWKQLGLYLNPIVILNVKNYFDPLLDMLRQAVDEKLHARAARCHLACGADTAGSRGTDIYHSLVGRLHP